MAGAFITAMDATVTILIIATVGEVITYRFLLAGSLPISLLAVLSFLLNLILYFLYCVFIYPEFVSPFRRLPGPPGGRHVVGHAAATIEKPAGVRLQEWNEQIPNDGVLRVRDIFGIDGLLITAPNFLKDVLSDNTYDYVKAPQVRNVLRLILGDGLVTVEGNEHKFQRKRLIPSFALGAIKDLYPVFWEKSTELTKSLTGLRDLKNVKFSDWCSRATLDIIGIAALGKDFNTLQTPDNELVKQYTALTQPDRQKRIWFMLNFMLPGWIISNIPFWKVPALVHRASTTLNNYARGLVSERRDELVSGVSLESKAEKIQLRRPDILSSLVQADELDATQLQDQVLTMMAAGHETTSSALEWASFLLAQHPKIQDELRAEIRANFPSPDSDETVATARLEKLPLLNGVCSETLRLYPTIPFTARTCAQPSRLGEMLIPKNTEIWIPIRAINRSSKFWGADADEFKPERWITDGAFNNNGGAHSNYASMTFSHGPRSCVGQGFARAELRCLVAAVVGRFHLDLAEPAWKYAPVGMISSKPENETPLNLTQVEGW